MRKPSTEKYVFLHRIVWTVALLALSGTPACVSKENVKRADGYYQEGLSLLKIDRQQAFVSFQRAVQENPQHKEALYYLAHLYARQGKYDEAEQRLRQVLDIDPDYSEGHTYLGQVLIAQDRWDDAIVSFRRALANPLYVTPDLARFHLGRALAHRGDMEGAIAAFEDALLVSPLSVPEEALQLELGRAYYRLGKDAQARKSLVRVVSLDQTGSYAEAANELLERLRP